MASQALAYIKNPTKCLGYKSADGVFIAIWLTVSVLLLGHPVIPGCSFFEEF